MHNYTPNTAQGILYLAPQQQPLQLPQTPPMGTGLERPNHRVVAQAVAAGLNLSGSGLSQNQSVSVPQDGQNVPGQRNLDEIRPLSPETSALIKTLIIKYSVLEVPRNKAEHDRLYFMYREFHTTADFGSNRPHQDDLRLWSLFTAKLTEIQQGMLDVGELYKTKEGVKLARPPHPNPRINIQPRSNTMSTPPMTPLLPNDEHLDNLQRWQTLDADAQSKLFRDQIRTAKDPQKLLFEWETFLRKTQKPETPAVEVPSTEQSNEPDVLVNSSTVQSTARTGVHTPIQTPPPPAKATDLKTMIQLRAQETILKRLRAKEQQHLQEETALKKQKADVS